MLAANTLTLPRSPVPSRDRKITTIERLPLLFRQLRIDARGLEELVVGIGDGRVNVRALPEAKVVEVKATVVCDDAAAVEAAVIGLADRLQILVDRPSNALARLLITLDEAPEALYLEVEITVPSSIALALDHAAEV